MWTAYHLLGDREEAAGAVQETFLRAYRGLDGFGGEGYVGAWIGRIVVNVCVSLLRARAAQRWPIRAGGIGVRRRDAMRRPSSGWSSRRP